MKKEYITTVTHEEDADGNIVQTKTLKSMNWLTSIIHKIFGPKQEELGKRIDTVHDYVLQCVPQSTYIADMNKLETADASARSMITAQAEQIKALQAQVQRLQADVDRLSNLTNNLSASEANAYTAAVADFHAINNAIDQHSRTLKRAGRGALLAALVRYLFDGTLSPRHRAEADETSAQIIARIDDFHASAVPVIDKYLAANGFSYATCVYFPAALVFDPERMVSAADSIAGDPILPATLGSSFPDINGERDIKKMKVLSAPATF